MAATTRTQRLTLAASFLRAVRLAARPGGPSLVQRLGALPRLVRATLRGEYPGVAVSRLLLLVAAGGYLLSPVDLVPEALLGPLGLADDAMVLTWLVTALVGETEDFLAWEQSGRPAGAPTAQPQPSPVVQGHVVR